MTDKYETQKQKGSNREAMPWISQQENSWRAKTCLTVPVVYGTNYFVLNKYYIHLSHDTFYCFILLNKCHIQFFRFDYCLYIYMSSTDTDKQPLLHLTRHIQQTPIGALQIAVGSSWYRTVPSEMMGGLFS